MKVTRNLFVGLSLVVVVVALSISEVLLENVAAAQNQGGESVPVFEVDPMWPKPLPNNWVIGGVVGLSVDAQDNIWMMHRPSFIAGNERAAANGIASICCYPAPPVLAFDQEGNLIKSWGPQRTPAVPGNATAGSSEIVPGWEQWAQSEHGLYVDYKGFVWTGGNGQKDSRVLKFSGDGKFIMQIGNFDPYGTSGPGHDGGPDSHDLENFNKPTTMVVDPRTDELYVADGYGNRRVIVFDADTGEYKRHWGAYGNVPDENDTYNDRRGGVDTDYDPDIASQQFGRATHGIRVSTDGRVYVADRVNNRVQAFTSDGTFVKEEFIDRFARGFGSAFDVALSADPDQRFVYVADGMNQRVVVLQRDTMQTLTRFGSGGPYPGQMYALHSIATDSMGNVYTGETLHGRRVQRWVYKGMR